MDLKIEQCTMYMYMRTAYTVVKNMYMYTVK